MNAFDVVVDMIRIHMDECSVQLIALPIFDYQIYKQPLEEFRLLKVFKAGAPKVVIDVVQHHISTADIVVIGLRALKYFLHYSQNDYNNENNNEKKNEINGFNSRVCHLLDLGLLQLVLKCSERHSRNARIINCVLGVFEGIYVCERNCSSKNRGY